MVLDERYSMTVPQTHVLWAHVTDDGTDRISEGLQGTDEVKKDGRRDRGVEDHHNRLFPRAGNGADLKG